VNSLRKKALSIIPQFFIARWLARQAEEDVPIEGLPEEKNDDWE